MSVRYLGPLAQNDETDGGSGNKFHAVSVPELSLPRRGDNLSGPENWNLKFSSFNLTPTASHLSLGTKQSDIYY